MVEVVGLLRIHLLQIHYAPAFFNQDVDYLEEPYFLPNTPLGHFTREPQIASFLRESRDLYLAHCKAKFASLLKWCGERGAHLVVFPEYSVPMEVLPVIRDAASHHGMTIVAASHRVKDSTQSRVRYAESGGKREDFPLGYACAPVFGGTDLLGVVKKMRKSKWEPDLLIENAEPSVLSLLHEGINLRFAVLLCIDTLCPEVLGSLWGNR